MTEAELGYIAGILDGEGSIYISRRIPKDGHHRTVIHRAFVIIVNTNLELLSWITAKVGQGSISQHNGAPTGHKKPCYKYVICGPAAARLLSDLLPMLIVKRKRAEIAIRLHLEGTWVPVVMRVKEKPAIEELVRRNALWEESRHVDCMGH